MYLFKKNNDLAAFLDAFKAKNRKVGFVPTMGALHEGHLSLIRASLRETSCTVASIFVNPTQFNESHDLDTYPRTPVEDIKLLHDAGCQVVYMPAVNEVYPDGSTERLAINFDHLTTSMEGAHRPGHFDGVAQVVKRLLDIVQPDNLYMGQKDYQQVMVVRHLVKTLALPVEVIMCPIIREEDGLAMSSRNRRLSEESRASAPVIHEALQLAKEWLPTHSPAQISNMAKDMLASKGLKPEYFELVNGNDLSALNGAALPDLVVACVAAWAGDVRLIDNCILKGSF
jgi:pantoate--beta-alanine ligase